MTQAYTGSLFRCSSEPAEYGQLEITRLYSYFYNAVKKLADHLETFLASLDADATGLPAYVQREFITVKMSSKGAGRVQFDHNPSRKTEIIFLGKANTL